MAAGARRLLGDVVVDPVGLDDLVADRVVGVQRGQRVLEDHRDLAAATLAHLLLAEREQVDAVEPDLAGRPGCVSRLCRPRIAELETDLPDPDSPTMPRVLPCVEVEAQAVDGLDEAVAGREVDREVLDASSTVADSLR